jgi:Fe2+ transport system protein FeoA
MTIIDLKCGDSAIIEHVGGTGALRDRLLDMGLTPGTLIYLRKLAPMGDPIQIALRGYELTIRKADAGRIEVASILEQSLNPFQSCDGDCASCGAEEK